MSLMMFILMILAYYGGLDGFNGQTPFLFPIRHMYSVETWNCFNKCDSV